MSANEWQDLFEKRRESGKYLMFLVDIVDSRHLTDEKSLEKRRDMIDVMQEFFELIKSDHPQAIPPYESLVWNRDFWMMELVTRGFLVQGDAYAVVLEAENAPNRHWMLELFFAIAAEHDIPFLFHSGFTHFDSLGRMDADCDTLTVNHCFALLEKAVKDED